MATLATLQPVRDDFEITDTKIKELVRRLVEAYDPVRVVAFGSWARGEAGPHSDFDVAVLVDGDSEGKRGRHSTDGIDMEMDLLVRPVERARRFASVKGDVYHAIATEGVVLYDRNAGEVGREPFYGSPSEEEHMRSKAEVLKSKLRKAASDEKSLNLAEQDHEVRGFHGQQAIEKLMKVWLMAVDVVPKHIHDLTKLKESLKEHELELPVLRTDLRLLTEYGAYWRYEEIGENQRVDLEMLSEDVKTLRSHVVLWLVEFGLIEA